MQKLPIGIQTFKNIKDDNYIYIDKTDIKMIKRWYNGYNFSFIYKNYCWESENPSFLITLLYERYYASLFYAYLAANGFDIIAKDTTNLGRVDITIKLGDKIYIIEFKQKAKSQKLKANENSALTWLKEKQYHLKYLNHNALSFELLALSICLIGIEFDTKKKNISSFEWEVVE